MRPCNRWKLLLVTFVIATSVMAAEPPGPIEAEVLSADTQRFSAMLKGDVAALDALLAPDAIYVNSQGWIDDKRSILYGIRSKATAYEAISPTERQVRVTGNVAVVRGVAAMRGVERKDKVDITVRYIAVYEKRDGRWQLTHGQSTQIVTPGTVISGQSA